MIFKPMEPDTVWKLIEGHECILPSVDTAARARVESSTCPECGDSALPVPDPLHPFDNQTAGFKYIARCSSCGCIFDHDSGIIRKIGNISPILTPTSGRGGG